MVELKENQKQITKGDLDTLLDSALAYHRSGDLVRAEAIYRRILEHNHEHFTALYNMTLLASDANKPDIALMYSNRAVKVMPNSPEAVAMLGNALLALGQHEKAASAFERATSLNPGYSLAHFNLAMCYNKMRHYEKALACYERVLHITPNDSDVYNNMGNIYESLGRLNRASKSYLSALKLSPYEIRASYNLATSLFFMQRYREIRAFLNEISERGALTPTQVTGLDVLEALVSFITDDTHECIRILNRILKRPANDETFPNYKEFSYYCVLAKKLVDYQLEHPKIFNQPHSETLHLIGDSPCLTGSFTVVHRHGVNYQCQPHLIMGAQANYLADTAENKFKTALRIALDSIHNNGHVLALFGETDCRFDYGILPYHKKIENLQPKAIKETVDRIVNRYVDFVVEEANKKKLKISFYGIPAHNFPQDTVPWEDAIRLKEIRVMFNESLAKKSVENECEFVDAFAVTSDEEGNAHKTYYIDEYHLTPKAFVETCHTPDDDTD